MLRGTLKGTQPFQPLRKAPKIEAGTKSSKMKAGTKSSKANKVDDLVVVAEEHVKDSRSGNMLCEWMGTSVDERNKVQPLLSASRS